MHATRVPSRILIINTAFSPFNAVASCQGEADTTTVLLLLLLPGLCMICEPHLLRLNIVCCSLCFIEWLVEIAGCLAHTAFGIRHASLVHTVADLLYVNQAFIVDLDSNALCAGLLTRNTTQGPTNFFGGKRQKRVNLHSKRCEKLQNA